MTIQLNYVEVEVEIGELIDPAVKKLKDDFPGLDFVFDGVVEFDPGKITFGFRVNDNNFIPEVIDDDQTVPYEGS